MQNKQKAQAVDKKTSRTLYFQLAGMGLAWLLCLLLLAVLCIYVWQRPQLYIVLMAFGDLLFFRWLYLRVWLPLYHTEKMLCAGQEGDVPLSLQKMEGISSYPIGQALLHVCQTQDERKHALLLEQQAELHALQGQINPHFLYNTLESIRGKAVVEQQDVIADMTEALANFFRYSINTQNDVVSLGEELENVKNYFKIQQFRFHNRFALDIQMETPALLQQCFLPKLTLQPIVENAIYHGLEGKNDAGHIHIRALLTQYNIIISISDDGVGMSQQTLMALQDKLQQGPDMSRNGKQGGIAIPNVHRRIQLLFGEQYGLDIMSMQGMGTDVEIIIPANHQPKGTHLAT